MDIEKWARFFRTHGTFVQYLAPQIIFLNREFRTILKDGN